MKTPSFFRNVPDPIIVFFAIVSVTIHLFAANNLGYHRDELLYFALGQHPATGYNSVPPLTGWIAFVMQNLFGYSLFAVRLLPAIMSGFMVLLLSSIVRELGGGQYARILSAIGFIIAGFTLRTYSLFQPVYMDVFFWTLILYLVTRYINSSSDPLLTFMGLIGGFSFLNKYLIAILFFSLFVIIPFTRYKDILVKKSFWIGIAAGLVIFLPNIIWQFRHDLPVIHHMSELNRTQLSHVERSGFLIDQLMMPSYATFFTIAGLLFILLNKKVRKFRFMGIACILVVLILFLLKGKSYYTIGIFPFLIAAGAVSYENSIKKPWIRVVFPLFLIVLTIPIVPMSLPVSDAKGMVAYFKRVEEKYGLQIGRRFEDGSIHSLPQDYADMLGWDELTELTDKAYRMIADKKAAFIYGANYGQASAITVIGKKYGLPEAISFAESYQYWVPKHFDPDITSMVYIDDEPPGEDVKAVFRKIYLIGSISNPDAREYGTMVYLCQDPVDSFNKFWKMVLSR
jgi:hypothetical protein